ncbi:MAG: DUF58 domain-containing protein [Xanthomonadales bacterium]|nr:DUF58 domain-containing protein [Xanthomonadales bacterium]
MDEAAPAGRPAFRHRLQDWIRRRGRVDPLPMMIDRRRVYVLPTTFGLFYGVLVAVMFLGALNYNNNPALLLSLLLLAAGLASLVYAHLQLSGLRVISIDAEPVHAGETLLVKIGLAADDARTRSGLQLDCAGGRAVAAVALQATTFTTLPVPTTRRGWLEAGRLELATTRPLGLACAWSWLWQGQGWLVYPAPETNGPPLPDRGDGGHRAKPASAGDDIHQLRPYRHGDAPHAIAWKASARATHLLTREYEQRIDADILLDWNDVRHLPHEHAISRLAHWVELAERHGHRYGLRPPLGRALAADRGPRHRHACLEALARLPERPA